MPPFNLLKGKTKKGAIMDNYNLSFKNLQKPSNSLAVSKFEILSLIALYGYLFLYMLPQVLAFFLRVEGGLK